ncbi:AAA family ATPase [Flavobacterium panacagri]|uniref:AAA family ATPase n=1 Tax=Flavobacterium panacagri TaxID=3034146 RepID=UPI0025A64BC9|nr:AAA family ATPase [Flavobacterium panacagri]
MDKTNFKILAVRPIVGCRREFSKVLKLGVIYKFYNDYEYFKQNGEVAGIEENNTDQVTNIIYTSTVPEDLYKIKTADGHEINLNISSVVGKNGAGKSTLLELLYALSYAIAIKDELIADYKYYLEKFEETSHAFFSEKFHAIQYVIDGLQLELYFSKGNSIFLLRNGPGGYSVFEFSDVGWKYLDKFHVGDLFYTIAVNYSIYALNGSLYENFWMNSLFHKNDGYRTPIVINPFRTAGNIDVNIEFHLTQTRILYNLSGDSIQGKYIVNKKKVDSLQFNIYPEELDSFGLISYKNVFELYQKDNKESVVILFVKLMKILTDYEMDSDSIDFLQQSLQADLKMTNIDDRYVFVDNELDVDYKDITYLCLKYAIRKLFRICSQYLEFNKFYGILSKDKPVPRLQNIGELLFALKEDNSHVTIKIRQILFSVKEKYFNNKWEIIRNPRNSGNKAYRNIVEINDFSAMIKKAESNNNQVLVEYLLPVAFFKPELFIKNDDSPNSASIFQTLSSGEQQLIQSVQSIIYHIINLNSVFNSYSTDKIRYKYLNIVLDEVELYYHPEYQKKFVSELVNSLSKLNIEHILGINILFSTHSPFLLSDIPNANILRIQNGEIINSHNELTFGSNIYDLLSNDFFIKDGSIGEYALAEIRKILDYTTKGKYDEAEHQYFKAIAALIGDDVIRNKLKELLQDVESLVTREEKIILLEKQMQEIAAEIEKHRK